MGRNCAMIREFGRRLLFVSVLFLVGLMLVIAPADQARQLSLGPVILAAAAIMACWMLIAPALTSIAGAASTSGEDTWFRSSQRIGEQFELFVRRENEHALEHLLCDALPDWPIRHVLRRAACELLELQVGVAISRERGLPAIMTESLTVEVEEAAHALGASVARIAAVGNQSIESPGITAALEQEAEWVERLRTVMRTTREELAEVVLRDGAGEDLIMAEQMMDWATSLVRDSARSIDPS